MIDPVTAWPQIRENAIKALKTGLVWHSLVEQAQYTLAEVFADKLIIRRVDGGQDQTLTEARVNRAAIDFNDQGCVVQRRHLISPTVAEETAFVLFHPELTWDEQNEFIIQINNL